VNLTCIVCPNGCSLDARVTPQGLVVTGHRCPKGEEYAREEVTDPHRTVTAVARTSSKEWPCAPVKTAAAVPRAVISAVLRQVRALRVDLPVRCGDVALRDAGGTGVAVVFTRSLPPPTGA
jgi:CxxC motif-containing protein